MTPNEINVCILYSQIALVGSELEKIAVEIRHLSLVLKSLSLRGLVKTKMIFCDAIRKI